MTSRTITTPWGQQLLENPEEIALNNYPRPQLRRDNWRNLNGWWEYAITKSDQQPASFEGKIRVPFSPETTLSGVGKMVGPTDFLWYRRHFLVNTKETASANRRTLLHFGAVDQICEVFLNGQSIGTHVGGYWPFEFDITHQLQADNELIVKVQDFSDNPRYAYGKQKQKHGQIWYTPQSGIWQTVWLEQVPQTYVTQLQWCPQFDEGQILLNLGTNQPFAKGTLLITSQEQVVCQREFSDTTVAILLPQVHPWTPADPHLYQVTLTVDEDRFTSYFGMRKFSIGKRNGVTVPLLNNQPVFFNGLLDQGYWSDGGYTPPSDEALVYDIQQMKDLGFNMLRKHIKIEPLRWYYHCDRLGMLVWQDFVSGGGPDYHPLVIQVLPFIGVTLKDHHYRWFGRQLVASRQQFRQEMHDTVKLLQNVTSLAVWVPFNEGWGQFDSLPVTAELRQLDPTRLIDTASGYHDQGAGDFHSAHVYFKKFRMKPDRKQRIQVLSEFGGYSLPVVGHMASDKRFGYKKFPDQERFLTAYLKLFTEEVLPAVSQGLAGTVYTQVSDVEDELNGLMTFDRRVLKVDENILRKMNHTIAETFQQLHKDN